MRSRSFFLSSSNFFHNSTLFHNVELFFFVNVNFNFKTFESHRFFFQIDSRDFVSFTSFRRQFVYKQRSLILYNNVICTINFTIFFCHRSSEFAQICFFTRIRVRQQQFFQRHSLKRRIISCST